MQTIVIEDSSELFKHLLSDVFKVDGWQTVQVIQQKTSSETIYIYWTIQLQNITCHSQLLVDHPHHSHPTATSAQHSKLYKYFIFPYILLLFQQHIHHLVTIPTTTLQVSTLLLPLPIIIFLQSKASTSPNGHYHIIVGVPYKVTLQLIL